MAPTPAEGTAVTATDALVRRFLDDHPVDAARSLETLDSDAVVKILRACNARMLAPVFDAMDINIGGDLLLRLDPEQRAEILRRMAPRQAASLMHQLDDAELSTLLESVPAQSIQRLKQILQYPAQTAGGMMEPRVTSLPIDLTAQQAVARLRRAPRETLYYLYVTDREGKLVGVLNMRDLLLAAPKDEIRAMVRQPVLSVHATMGRDEVVETMREKGFLAVPVVDTEERLIGVVLHDEAMQASQADAFEDFQRLVGAGADEQALSPILTVVKRRLPWLYVNLLTAFIAAAVVGLFEGVIEQVTALAVLLPVVAGQGGNTGAQSLAVVMRGLALKELVPGTERRVLIKEAISGLINGVAIAVVTAAAVYIWQPNIGLALVIGLAMPVNMLAAAIAGALIPLVLRALGRDPAQSASIFLTTVTDVVGFAAFLGFAVLLLPLILPQ